MLQLLMLKDGEPLMNLGIQEAGKISTVRHWYKVHVISPEGEVDAKPCLDLTHDTTDGMFRLFERVLKKMRTQVLNLDRV